MEDVFAYPLALRAVLFALFAVSSILIVTAILSAKALGGKLGLGLKKIAGGTILHAALFVLLVLLEQGWTTNLNPDHLRLFTLTIVMIGSGLMIWGFYEIYKIGKELKLFY
jgi:hypothetical protein